MNLIYDIRLDTVLCPCCNGPAHWTKKGLQCEWDKCKYFYTIFPVKKSVNIFQLELDF